MSENNPFSIRLRLLELSKEILNERFQEARNAAAEDFYTKRELKLPNHDELKFPRVSTPTIEEVMAGAEKLNEFVSQNRSVPVRTR